MAIGAGVMPRKPGASLINALGPLLMGATGFRSGGSAPDNPDLWRRLVESTEGPRARMAARGTGGIEQSMQMMYRMRDQLRMKGLPVEGIEAALARARLALVQGLKGGGQMPGVLPFFMDPRKILPPNLQGIQG